jgi:hypothetical protein
MKHKTIFFLFLLLCACHSKNINDVKKGMKSSDVLSIMGKPDNETTLPMGIQWWNYKTGTVVIVSDTVSGVKTPESEKRDQEVFDSTEKAVTARGDSMHAANTKAFDEMQKTLDSAQAVLDSSYNN